MEGKTHKIGGLIVGLGLISAIPQHPLAMVGTVGCSVIGSLFPDLDKRNSTISKKAKVVGWITSAIFKHRGLMHSLLPYTMVYPLLLPLINHPASVFLTGWYFGVLSHLLLDMLTPEGIPILAPISKKRVSLLGVFSIRTGGKAEIVFRMCLSILCAVHSCIVVWNLIETKVLEFLLI